MTKWLTVSKVPQLVELFGGQIDDLCGKHSVLVRKRKDGRHSLLFSSIMAEVVGDKAVAKQSAVGGVTRRRGRVGERWETQRGLLLSGSV